MYARYIAFATLPIAAAVLGAYLLSQVGLPTHSRTIDGAHAHLALGDTLVEVELATTTGARSQGLGGRAGLAEGSGMLFVFPKDGTYSFWMKDMLFAIDIIWLDANARVVFAAEHVVPESYPAIFTPHTAARYVLELPAGFVAEHHIGVGDVLTFTDGVPRSTE